MWIRVDSGCGKTDTNNISATLFSTGQLVRVGHSSALCCWKSYHEWMKWQEGIRSLPKETEKDFAGTPAVRDPAPIGGNLSLMLKSYLDVNVL